MGSDYLFSLNNTKRGPARVRLKMAAAILALYSTREGRAVSGIFQCVQEIDARLLAQCQKNYPGELALFAVSRSMRKSGIGRALFEKHLAYLHSQNIREFSCSQTQAVIIRFMSTGAWCGAQKRSTPFRPAAFRKRCVFSSMISSRAPRPESLPQTQKASAARHRPDKLRAALPTFWERGQA